MEACVEVEGWGFFWARRWGGWADCFRTLRRRLARRSSFGTPMREQRHGIWKGQDMVGRRENGARNVQRGEIEVGLRSSPPKGCELQI